MNRSLKNLYVIGILMLKMQLNMYRGTHISNIIVECQAIILNTKLTCFLKESTKPGLDILAL